MSERLVELLILAEDKRSFRLLRRYAQKIRVDPRRIRGSFCSGGSGKQYVRGAYPSEVREQRRVSHKIKKVALLVHLDADNSTVDAEKARLDAELGKAGESPRSSGERIAIVIPKRHTETWLHGLCGASVTETQDCKRDPALRRIHDSRINGAADALYGLTRMHATPPPGHMPSLASAVPELQRLER